MVATKSKYRNLKPLYDVDDWSRQVATPSGFREAWRSDTRKDYARLVHCPSFRRLQGKTQLFPSHESDFFRNRLTHSMEVAQIAKSIAIQLNNTHEYFKLNPIDLDLVEFAALAHDIGHPPFGHNGEAVLDKLMLDSGGFEGNAQTLRILACTEKKETRDFPGTSPTPLSVDGTAKTDLRRGLNVTYRCLASVLKYDVPIPVTKKARSESGSAERPFKGHYDLEASLVSEIKSKIAGHLAGNFKTIECSIMDVADDIAYSTYDIEDSFKAGFLSPISMISASDRFKGEVAKKVERKTKAVYGVGTPGVTFSTSDVNEVLGEIFWDLLRLPDAELKMFTSGPVDIVEAKFKLSAQAYETSKEIGRNGYIRTAFTSQLVGKFINAIKLNFNEDCPKLSSVTLDIDTFRMVETLKTYSFEQLIESPMLKLAERRGKEIIEKIFQSLVDDGDLLPDDWKAVYKSIDDTAWQRRVICDYISGMTDRYCVELYARITGYNPMTIWKPH